MQLTTLLLSSGLFPLALATYNLRDDYGSNNFFNKFTFDTVRTIPPASWRIGHTDLQPGERPDPWLCQLHGQDQCTERGFVECPERCGDHARRFQQHCLRPWPQQCPCHKHDRVHPWACCR